MTVANRRDAPPSTVTKLTKRLLILDPKDAAIHRALDNMEDNSKYYSWYQAGLLRSQADWLIDMNFTRAFTNLSRVNGGEGVTSVGLIQTPILKLIYDRDLAISNFKPLNYYNLHDIFSNQIGQQFMTKLDYTGLGFQLNEQVQQIKSEIKKITTKKPKAYTEGSLVKTMTNIHNELENIVKSYYSDPTQIADMVLRYKKVLKDTAGLGTEATRSNIIKTLKLREFIELKAKNIQITDKGRTFMQLLTSNDNLLNFSMLISPLTTAIYEQQLEDILNHRFTVEQFNKNLYELLHGKLDIVKCLMPNPKAVSSINSPPTITDEKCPKCNGGLVEREGKFGKFKSCRNYPKCKYTLAKKLKADQVDKPEA